MTKAAEIRVWRVALIEGVSFARRPTQLRSGRTIAITMTIAELHVPDLFPDRKEGLDAIRSAITFRYRPVYDRVVTA